MPIHNLGAIFGRDRVHIPSHTGLALSWFASISGSLSPIRRWKRVSNSMSDKGLTPKSYSDITDV